MKNEQSAYLTIRRAIKMAQLENAPLNDESRQELSEEVQWITGELDHMQSPKDMSEEQVSHVIWGMKQQVDRLQEQLQALPLHHPQYQEVSSMLQMMDHRLAIEAQATQRDQPLRVRARSMAQTEVDREIYEPVVEERLKEYATAKEAQANIHQEIIMLESDQYMITTPMTAKYGERSGGSGMTSSAVETSVLRHMDRIRDLQQQYSNNQHIIFKMEQALFKLEAIHQDMIQYFYLEPRRSQRIYGEAKARQWNIGRTTLYRTRDLAIDALAEALKII